jgi:hypothetical protein
MVYLPNWCFKSEKRGQSTGNSQGSSSAALYGYIVWLICLQYGPTRNVTNKVVFYKGFRIVLSIHVIQCKLCSKIKIIIRF